MGSRGNDVDLDIDAGWLNLRPTQVGLVSTNSIVQGEQVSILWDWMLELGMEITFAHRTFAWANEGKGNAAVHCIIVGFSSEPAEAKRLYFYPDLKGEPVEVLPLNISPYLVDAPSVVATNRTEPLTDAPAIHFGSMANDDGNLIMSSTERAAAIAAHPELDTFIRPFIGAKEMLHDLERYVLWLKDSTPQQRANPIIAERVKAVREYRLKSGRKTTRKLATTSYLFGETRQPTTPYLMVPSASSQRRDFVPVGYFAANVIASNLVYTIPDASLTLFGVVSSSMHNAWVRTVGGRLKSDYRYSAGLVYNTFPWPDFDNNLPAIDTAAQAVLDVRSAFPDSSLATLYNPDLTPAELTRAHITLDRAVDKAYGYKGADEDVPRLEFLFERFSMVIAGQLV